jgi:ABC-type antimicrobial peptide transport system permease subunit
VVGSNNSYVLFLEKRVEGGNVVEHRPITVSITNEQIEWLEAHPEINRSQLFREAIDFKMKTKQGRVSSLMFLASVMCVTFSIVLIAMAYAPSFLDIYIRGILAILGGIMIVVTTFLYYKERKKTING